MMINLEQALQVVTNAMEVANNKGAFSLQDSATVYAALQVIVKEYKPVEKESEEKPEQKTKDSSKKK